MHFKPALIFSLFASTALANLHRRKQSHNKSTKHVNHNITNEGSVSSNNWAGAILDGEFLTISADFKVPVPTGDPTSGASAWVGIDGYLECPNSLLQTGVSFTVGVNGEPEYQGWYEWLGPNGATFVDMPIHAGDDIKLSIVVLSPTEGLVGIENLSSGNSLAFSVPSSNSPLCGKSAEWIVEDYQENGVRVPFAGFDSVTFMNAEVTPAGGTPTSPNGANIAFIAQSGKALTSTSIDGSSVTVKRTG